jgi:hypothetical protein
LQDAAAGRADPTRFSGKKSKAMSTGGHLKTYSCHLCVSFFAVAALQEAAAGPADPTKFSGKKSKAMSKKGAGATQWEILMKSGIPPEEIPEFRCAVAYWLLGQFQVVG